MMIAAGTWTESSAQELFRFTEKPGPYSAGFKVVEQYDYSRTYRHATDELGKPYQGERARPVQTLVWYPAERSNGTRMTYRDYVNLLATETSFGHPNMPVQGKEWLRVLQPSLGSILWAVRDAPLASGRFPVLVYAPGGAGPAWDNADLCEYLASYGYVVIASPMKGTTTYNITTDVRDIDTPAGDISFLIGYAQTLPDTDMSQVAVAGMSWGGIANVFAAARDSRIRALIALDGSLRYFPGFVKRAGDVHPDELSVPLLAFIQRNFSLEDDEIYSSEIQKDGPNVLNEWTHGDLFVVRMLGLNHAFYESMYQRNEDMWWQLPRVMPTMQGDYGRQEAMTEYGWMARYTLQFLDGYLKHDANAMKFLQRSPATNDAPPHVAEITYRPASGPPVSFDGLRTEVGQAGFDHLADVYAAFKKQKPDFTIGEIFLVDWADELLSHNHIPEAICVLTLNLQMHPNSSGAFQNLGYAYEASGQKEMAIDYYTKAVEIDPSNGIAARKLYLLKGVDQKSR
jgi:dienelactone hydrolase